MSGLIATIISGESRPYFPLVVLESSLVQSSLPVLRAFVNNGDASSHVLFFSLLYPPSALAGDPPREGLHVVDRTAEVPGYSETSSDLSESILNTVIQGAMFCFTLWTRASPKFMTMNHISDSS
jgi:hypothetical protein